MEHADCLGTKIRNVWDALGATGERYVLIGGTALARRLGHRESFDIDLVTSRPASIRACYAAAGMTPGLGRTSGCAAHRTTT